MDREPSSLSLSPLWYLSRVLNERAKLQACTTADNKALCVRTPLPSRAIYARAAVLSIHHFYMKEEPAGDVPLPPDYTRLKNGNAE
jgi:hypothetical protein